MLKVKQTEDPLARSISQCISGIVKESSISAEGQYR